MEYSTSDGANGGLTVTLVCGIVVECDDTGRRGEGLSDVLAEDASMGFTMSGMPCVMRGLFDGVEVSRYRSTWESADVGAD